MLTENFKISKRITVNEYLKKEVKTTPKKYLIYAVTSLVSFITALGILKFVLHTGPV